MSETISQKELRKLQKQGFGVVSRNKPPAKPEEKLLKIAQQSLDALKEAIEVNTRTAIGVVDESKKQTAAIARAIGAADKKAVVAVTEKARPKKVFEMVVTERDKLGDILKVKISEV